MDDFVPMSGDPSQLALPPSAASVTAQRRPRRDWPELDAEEASQIFQDPEFLVRAAAAFLRRGRREGLQWLERSHQAAQENVFEALQNFEMGDGDAAVTALGKSNRLKDAIGATRNDDGTWTAQHEGWPSTTFNAADRRRSLMDPLSYLQYRGAEPGTSH